jgi:hypothetical protein
MSLECRSAATAPSRELVSRRAFHRILALQTAIPPVASLDRLSPARGEGGPGAIATRSPEEGKHGIETPFARAAAGRVRHRRWAPPRAAPVPRSEAVRKTSREVTGARFKLDRGPWRLTEGLPTTNRLRQNFIIGMVKFEPFLIGMMSGPYELVIFFLFYGQIFTQACTHGNQNEPLHRFGPPRE